MTGISKFKFKSGLKYDITPGKLGYSSSNFNELRIDYFHFKFDGYSATINSYDFNKHFLSLEDWRNLNINKIIK